MKGIQRLIRGAYLETKFSLEKSVHCLGVGAAIRVVDAVVPDED